MKEHDKVKLKGKRGIYFLSRRIEHEGKKGWWAIHPKGHLVVIQDNEIKKVVNND